VRDVKMEDHIIHSDRKIIICPLLSGLVMVVHVVTRLP
jgi:hypothetical protein